MSTTHLPPHIRAMLQPAFYPHTATKVELIQTHISWVFLAGDFAYKVKKPVDFSFLNFTTLDKRKYYCERELELNRRLSPTLYLDVLPIHHRDGDIRLDGPGEVLEYCLKMARFSQNDLLDRRLQQGLFDAAWMDELAHDIARFHAQAERAPEDSGFGSTDSLRSHIEAIFSVARQHLGEVLSAEELASLETQSMGFLATHDMLCERRCTAGFIRACHGDLHLKNIALYQGHPCIFDCIEFNDAFRMIDTMNDIAFLVMDCMARDRADLAWRFLSRYLEHSGDYAGLGLLPLYLAYRAGVRGKVACLLAADGHLDHHQHRAQLAEARCYFQLAPGFITRPTPHLFVIGGLSGSGKSHLALVGAGEIPAIVIRSDATRKRLAHSRPDLPLYGQEMNAKTYATMFDAARTALAASFSVILDATFLHREDRDTARAIASSMHIPGHIFWLDMPEDILRQRILARGKQGADISDADIRVLEMQLREYVRPDEPDVEFLRDSSQWPAYITSTA